MNAQPLSDAARALDLDANTLAALIGWREDYDSGADASRALTRAWLKASAPAPLHRLRNTLKGADARALHDALRAS